MLNILEHFDLAAEYKRDPARALHIIAEAMKLAFADRAYWLGDPDFVDVPRGLIDKEYAAELAKRIDPEHATPVETHGKPPRRDRGFVRPEAHDAHRRGRLRRATGSPSRRRSTRRSARR